MKRIISIIFCCTFCSHYAGAQTLISTQKNTQITKVTPPVDTPIVSSNTATLISGERNSVIRELPIENKQEVTPTNSKIISTERKPK